MKSNQIPDFKHEIYSFYKSNRRDFPWRNTRDPYQIMVSELMLQQTQTHRVLPKYLAFLYEFPDVQTLASAPLSAVLISWSGLGYNRRAKFLHQAAIELHKNYADTFPENINELQKLPGIGSYTARAIATFAFNQPHVFLETNIRTVFIHFFLKDREKVTDKEILALVAQTVDHESPRDWYYALMDYGNYLKSQKISYFEKQKNYTKQSKFKGSERFVRGYILKQLVKNGSLNADEIILTGYTKEQIDNIIKQLHNENLIKIVKKQLFLP